jgi:mannose-6-phosphate isomerase-like protein (cupin superfamily)
MAAVFANAEGQKREGFDDPARGNAAWVRFFSSEITSTTDMSAGVMELPAHDGVLEVHRHTQAELYFVAEGAGVITIDGVERAVAAGDGVFIPGDALHGLRNTGDAVLKVFYVFPTASFSEVIYRFGDAE